MYYNKLNKFIRQNDVTIKYYFIVQKSTKILINIVTLIDVDL